MKKILIFLLIIFLPSLLIGQDFQRHDRDILNTENTWTKSQHFDTTYTNVTIIDYIDVEVIDADTLYVNNLAQFGGGYGDTGVTITSAGAISANGAIISDVSGAFPSLFSSTIYCSNVIVSSANGTDVMMRTREDGNICLDINPWAGADGFIKLGDTGTAGEYTEIDSVGIATFPIGGVKITAGAAPGSPVEGQMCITSTGDSMGVYLASGWKWFIAGE